ncbi:replication factor-A carboxy-terminal domain protein, partial [Trifolium pratense]
MTQLCQKSSKGKEPITQLSQPSSMLRAATMLKDINNTKELWKIAVKVKDIWQVVKDGKESFELVVVDSKGDDITIIVPHELNAKFNTLIIEKNSYTIQNFQVLKNDDQFKQSQHQFKLRLTGGTRVFYVNQHDIPYPMAKFKDFLEIEEGIWRQDFLYDIIGVVDDIGYTQRFQGSKKVQINFRLRDVSNNKICCTLWENYATQLITYMDEKTDAGGTIVCMKYAKIKPAGKFPLTVSNTWTTTKLFINDKILEILNFQK